jgi:hypothetical protein
MKEKTEFLTNFNFFLIPMMEILQKEFQSLCNFSFLKIVKIFEEVFCAACTALK